MSREKELAKNTAILTFGKICTQCISFLLLPLYTALLNASEYGRFDLLITYGTLLIPLVNWQFDQGIFRFMLEYRHDKRKQKGLFSTIVVANTVQSILFFTVFKLIDRQLNIPYGNFLVWYVILHVYTALFMQFARGLGQNKIYAFASFISAAFTIVLNVIFLVHFKWGLKGLLMATLASQFITILYLSRTICVWKYFSIKVISKEIYYSVKKYSIPLIPNNLAWWVVNVSDRTIVSYILGLTANGIYTVANKFSGFFIQFYNIFNLSWTETVALHYQDEDRDTFLSETITVIYKLFASTCFLICAVMPFVFPIIINERYSDAYWQIIILMYAMLLRVIVGLYSSVYVAQKNSKVIAYTSVASAIINIMVHIICIGKIGLYAASLSTLVAFGTMALIRYKDINKMIKMRISNQAIFSSVGIAVILLITYYINIIFLNIGMLLLVILYCIWLNRDIIVLLKKIRIKDINI